MKYCIDRHTEPYIVEARLDKLKDNEFHKKIDIMYF